MRKLLTANIKNRYHNKKFSCKFHNPTCAYTKKIPSLQTFKKSASTTQKTNHEPKSIISKTYFSSFHTVYYRANNLETLCNVYLSTNDIENLSATDEATNDPT